MTTSLRVLLAHNHYTQKGGEDVVFQDESELLRNRGHDVFHCTRHNDTLERQGIQLAASTIWNRRSATEVVHLIQKHRIDILHAHNLFPILSPAVLTAAKRAGVTVVKTLHNFRMLCPNAVFFRDGRPCYECHTSVVKQPALKHKCYRDSRAATAVTIATSLTHRYLKTYQRSVDAFIAPSEYAKQTYLVSGYPMSTIHVKPHFVPNDLGFASGSGGFALFVGRLSEEKGLQTLIQASTQLPHIPVKIVGVGPLEPFVQNLPSHITWLGKLSGEEVCDLMGQAACQIVPSDCGETFGRVIIEAFSRGTPVICSNHGGQAELVNSSRGALFQPTDVADLIQKISQFFEMKPHWPKIRSAARQAYEDRFTAARNYDRLMEIYQFARSRSLAEKRADPLRRGPKQH